MDWLDQYLDELSKGVKNTTFPPDSPFWNKKTLNQQQKRLVEDSIVYDLQKERVIAGKEETEMGDSSGGDSTAISPTSTPEPSPTLEPTATPTNTPTPTVTPDPTLTPTPGPTSTPTITPTPGPTATPTPTPTITPTPTPVPPSPSDTELGVWLKADTNLTLQPTNASSGTGITQWNDSSTFANHNVAPVNLGPSNRPVWITPSLGSLGALTFNGAGQALQTNVDTWYNGLTGCTIMFVASARKIDGQQTLGGTNIGGLRIALSGNNNTSRWYTQVAGGSAYGPEATQGGHHVYTLIYNSLCAAADRMRFRIDGIEQILFFLGTPGTSTGVSNRYYIGSTETYDYFNGAIGEIIFYTSSNSDATIINYESYLKNKWGTP